MLVAKSKRTQTTTLKDHLRGIAACAVIATILMGGVGFAHYFEAIEGSDAHQTMSDMVAPPAEEPSPSPSPPTDTTGKTKRMKSTVATLPGTKKSMQIGQDEQVSVDTSNCPAPNFNLTATKPSGSSNDLYVIAVPVTNDPGVSSECSNAINYATPVVTHPSNGHFCGATLSAMASNGWVVSCTVDDGTPDDSYTFTFSVTATNSQGQAATKTASHTYSYYN